VTFFNDKPRTKYINCSENLTLFKSRTDTGWTHFNK